VSVPVGLLNKFGQLTPDEIAIVRNHSRAAYDILEGIDYPCGIRDIILQHHERLDGSGYPDGVLGDAISTEARILAVADVVEAMSSDRPYREALGIDQALQEISAGRGTIYDRDVVDACLSVIGEGCLLDK